MYEQLKKQIVATDYLDYERQIKEIIKKVGV